MLSQGECDKISAYKKTISMEIAPLINDAAGRKIKKIDQSGPSGDRKCTGGPSGARKSTSGPTAWAVVAARGQLASLT